MKIVFLAPFGIRPKGTLLARMLPLAVALQGLGHTVTIIAPPYTNPEDAGTSEIVRGVRLVNVWLGPGGKVFSAIPIAWRMLHSTMAEKPDLIHLFKPKGYGGIAAMLLISLKRIGLKIPPVFLDTDDLEGTGGMNELHSYSSLEKQVYVFQERWLTKLATGITVASLALQKFVADMGVASNKIFYLPNCVEHIPVAETATTRQKHGISSTTPLLLLYTRFFEFDQQKLHILFTTIKSKLPSVRFLVVGKGRHGEELLLQEASQKLGFADALIMTGWVEPEQLPELLACADLAVYPFEDTLINRAKCPAKLTELLRSGIPVVADMVGQIPGYLAPQLHAFLCTPGDTDLMAENCVELLINRDKCLALGQAGRDYIMAQFRWPDYASKLDQFYKTLN